MNWAKWWLVLAIFTLAVFIWHGLSGLGWDLDLALIAWLDLYIALLHWRVADAEKRASAAFVRSLFLGPRR
jgi:hypothetical protein